MQYRTYEVIKGNIRVTNSESSTVTKIPGDTVRLRKSFGDRLVLSGKLRVMPGAEIATEETEVKTESSPEEKLLENLLESKVADIKSQLPKFDTVEVLKRMYEMEQLNANRSTLLEAIADRIGQIGGRI